MTDARSRKIWLEKADFQRWKQYERDWFIIHSLSSVAHRGRSDLSHWFFLSSVADPQSSRRTKRITVLPAKPAGGGVWICQSERVCKIKEVQAYTTSRQRGENDCFLFVGAIGFLTHARHQNSTLFPLSLFLHMASFCRFSLFSWWFLTCDDFLVQYTRNANGTWGWCWISSQDVDLFCSPATFFPYLSSILSIAIRGR